MPNHRRPQNHTHPDLPNDLETAGKSFLVLLEDLDVVVDEPNGSEPHGGENHELGVDVCEVREQQRRQEDRTEDDEAAHGGGALLVHLAFEAEVPHNLAHLLQLQALDDALAKQNAH